MISSLKGKRTTAWINRVPARRFVLRLYRYLFAVVAMSSTAFGQHSYERISNSRMDLYLNPDTRSVDGTELLVWYNNSGRSIDRIYFRICLNRYGLNPPAARDSRSSVAGGRIDIIGVTDLEGDRDLTSRISFSQFPDGEESGGSVMELLLPRYLASGDSVRLKLVFHSRLPEFNPRTRPLSSVGWTESSDAAPGTDEIILAAGFYPQVLIDGNDDRDRPADPKQFRFAENDFDVAINVPHGYDVFSSGEEVGQAQSSSSGTVFHYTESDAGEFDFVASSGMLVRSKEFRCPGGSTQKEVLLLRPAHADLAVRCFAALDTALEYFVAEYGKPKYPELTVIDPPECIDGEACDESYASMILAGPGGAAAIDDHYLERSIIDGVALQYWQCRDGSFEDAWTSSGPALLMSRSLLEEKYGPAKLVFSPAGLATPCARSVGSFSGLQFALLPCDFQINETDLLLPPYLANPCVDASALRWDRRYIPASTGEPRRELDESLRDKSLLAFHTLEGIIGRQAMSTALRSFRSEYAPADRTIGGLQKECERASGRDLEWFFAQLVHGTGTLDFSISGISYYTEKDLSTGASSDVTTVTVSRDGAIVMPVTLRVMFDDGSRIDTVWSGATASEEFEFRSGSAPVCALLDPEDKIPIDIDYANNSMLVKADFLPVVEWGHNILNYFQNILFTLGALI